MVTREILINLESGLESKAAAMFIQKASNFKSTIWLEKGNKKANAKSLLGLLSLGVGSGGAVTLIVEGEDEETAANELQDYAASGMASKMSI